MPVDVLLVEDNAADVLLVQEALADFADQVQLHVAYDGEHALQLLTTPEFPRPRFILMDANTPRKGGLEVLAELRQIPECAGMPVVIYSSSNNPSDALLAYEAGANAYLTKPATLDAFFELVHNTVQFWLATVVEVSTDVRG